MSTPAILTDDDHARGCQGREYACTCGYDERVAAVLSSQAAEIAEMRMALVDETAWLIEFKGQGGPCYYGKTDEGTLGLTWDHLVAVRFSRAKDAQAVIDDTDWTEAEPVEHMWSAPRAALTRKEG